MSFSITTDNGTADSVDVIFDDGGTGRQVGVSYGPDASYGQTAPAALISGTSYKATLQVTGIATVHYQCFVNGDLSDDQTYIPAATQVGPPPVVAPPAPDGSIVISWQTAAPGEGSVQYTPDGGTAMSQPDDEDATPTDHKVTLTDLVAGMHYSCQYTTDLDDSDVNIVSAPFDITAPAVPMAPPGHVAMRAVPIRLRMGCASTVTVQVLNKDGSPQVGIPVAFSLGAGKATLTPATAQGMTDAQGLCQARFTGTDVAPQKKKGRRHVVAIVGAAGGKQKRRRALIVVFK